MSGSEKASPAAARTLLAASRELIAVLTEENGALVTRRPGALKGILARKTAAARAYERAAAAFAELAPADVAAERDAIDPATLTGLRAAATALNALGRENAFRLDVARTAQRRLIEHIIDAAKEAVAPGPATYARNGRIGASDQARRPAVASLSFNRAL